MLGQPPVLADLAPVVSSDAIPSSTEVAIIGGGVVGASAALCLAEKGAPVCLFEKGQIGGEQSGRNWGWVRKMGRPDADIDLSILSETLWERMDVRVGRPTGYRKIGSLYLCDSEEELEAHARWKREVADPRQVGSALLSARQLDALLPGGKRPFVGALYTPTDGCAEPFLAAPAIANAARDKGATILTGCAARGVETTAGKVSAVITERGRVACNAVVLAAGAWTRLFCSHLGLDFPQLRLLDSVLQSEPMAGPDLCVGASDFAFRRRLDGGYTIARRNSNLTFLTPDHFRLFFQFLPTLREKRNLVQIRADTSFFEAWKDEQPWHDDEPTVFERKRVLDPSPREKTLESGLRNLKAAYPVFEKLELRQKWAGFIEGMPDALPVLSSVDSIPGLVLASGFSGQGFGPGPAAGQIISELVRGAPPSIRIGQYRFGRFGDDRVHRSAAA